MAATLAPQAAIRAAAIVAAVMLAGPSVAQDDTTEAGSTESTTARPEIVTDPDLRRAEERRRRIAVLSGLFERQTRVFRISYRLLYAAVDMCEDNVRPAMGFTYANAFMFQGAVRTAASDMGLTHRVSIVEIAPNSAASRAGLRVRDQLLAIGDWPVPYGEGAVTLTQAKLRDVLVRDNRAELILRRDGNQFSVTLEPDFICDIKVLAVPGEQIRAFAGEDNVVVFAGLHHDVEDDNVMAAAIAREISNSLLPGMGLAPSSGGGLDLSNFFNWGFEPEPTGDAVTDQSLAQDYGNAADYVGAYLMARAGFDHRQAPTLWRRMAGREAPPPEHSYGAPDAEYIQSIELAVAEIDRKLSAREPLKPETTDPPMQFAAAPPLAGPMPSPESAPPAPTEIAEAPPPIPEGVEPQTAEAQSSSLQSAEASDLPWLTPDTAQPEANPPSGTEVAGMPWASEPSETESESVEPAPADTGITVSALDDASIAAQLGEPLSEPPQTVPLRGADNTLIPGTEPPRFAMAELGIEPASEAPNEPDTSSDDIAATALPEESGQPLDAVPEADRQVAAVTPPDTPEVTGRTTSIPNSESPQLAMAALSPIDIPPVGELGATTSPPETTAAREAEQPVDSVLPDASDTAAAMPAPAQPDAATRKLVIPPTGDAEVAMLFRNQGPSQQSATTEPDTATSTPPSDEAAAPQLAAVGLPDTEPPALIEKPIPNEAEDYDIGDLIRALEAVDDAADDKLTLPEPPASETETLPWRSQPDTPTDVPSDDQATDSANTEADDGPQNSLPVLPATTNADNPDLSPAVPSDPTLIEPTAGGPAPTAAPDDQTDAPIIAALPVAPDQRAAAQQTETPPEPIVDLVPMYNAPVAQTTQAPDRAALPVAGLPAIPDRVDTGTVAVPTTEDSNSDAQIDDATVESTIDLIAPAAGQSSPGADPADLGKGFSFRTWLGES